MSLRALPWKSTDDSTEATDGRGVGAGTCCIPGVGGAAEANRTMTMNHPVSTSSAVGAGFDAVVGFGFWRGALLPAARWDCVGGEPQVYRIPQTDRATKKRYAPAPPSGERSEIAESVRSPSTHGGESAMIEASRRGCHKNPEISSNTQLAHTAGFSHEATTTDEVDGARRETTSRVAGTAAGAGPMGT